MRKKFLFAFYILSSLIVCSHLAVRVNLISDFRTSNTPLFVVSHSTSSDTELVPVKETIDYREWAEKFEEQTK
ncbi:hypothetical protein [uncultured Shewanella sp.]|uniref:hypothetical protein n=1 Tax=uncultured Shewanella sp. TaxID=173975 RepID=UPI002628B591|nr:hypothetical protein [uncultured Shewanella sp.]